MCATQITAATFVYTYQIDPNDRANWNVWFLYMPYAQCPLPMPMPIPNKMFDNTNHRVASERHTATQLKVQSEQIDYHFIGVFYWRRVRL